MAKIDKKFTYIDQKQPKLKKLSDLVPFCDINTLILMVMPAY